MRPRRCRICGQSYSPDEDHGKTVHRHYWQWLKKFRRDLLILGAGTIPILIIVDYFAIVNGNYILLLLANASYIVGWQIFLVRLPLKQRQMKREWNREAWDEPVVYTDSQLGCGQIQQGKRVGPTKLIKLHRRAMKLTASLKPIG